MGHNGSDGMRRKKPHNQLELFSLRDARSIEEEILRLEEGIQTAMRHGNLRLAARLTQEQQVLLQNQIARKRREFSAV